MRRRVLIAGGGVGGLETALALRALAGERVDVQLLAPERHFVYRPLAVSEPFGRGQTVQVEVSRIAAERGFGVTRDVLDAVVADERAVITQDGRHIEYDDLVLALGARPRVAVPGALTFRGPQDAPRVAQALGSLQASGGPARVAFLSGAGTTWTLPLYELALLTRAWAIDAGLELDLCILTPESRPLEAFGPDCSDRVQRLLKERGIVVYPDTLPESFGRDGVAVKLGARVGADLAVALPTLVGPSVRGLPLDACGFTPVDDYGRVEGLESVYAIGDMTTHRIKQGGLAAQQADVAASVIAAAAGAPVRREPYRPVLRGLLFTGGAPLYLRHPPGADALVPPDAWLMAPWWPAHKRGSRTAGPPSLLQIVTLRSSHGVENHRGRRVVGTDARERRERDAVSEPRLDEGAQMTRDQGTSGRSIGWSVAVVAPSRDEPRSGCRADSDAPPTFWAAGCSRARREPVAIHLDLLGGGSQ